jgi:hypothetical protein
VAEATLRELGRPTLGELLELVHLIAHKSPHRHGRAGARWLRRYLDANPDSGLDDVAFLAGCLSALGGPKNHAALTALRAVASSSDGHGQRPAPPANRTSG